MNFDLIQQGALYGAAICIALVVYFISSAISFEKSPAKRVKRMVETSAVSIFDKGGARIADRMSMGIFSAWKSTLDWAQINGSYTDWSLGGMLLRLNHPARSYRVPVPGE